MTQKDVGMNRCRRFLSFRTCGQRHFVVHLFQKFGSLCRLSERMVGNQAQDVQGKHLQRIWTIVCHQFVARFRRIAHSEYHAASIATVSVSVHRRGKTSHCRKTTSNTVLRFWFGLRRLTYSFSDEKNRAAVSWTEKRLCIDARRGEKARWLLYRA